MGRKKYKNKKTDKFVVEIQESLQDIANDSKGLQDIKSHTEELVKNSRKKLPVVIAIISMIVAVIGTIVAIMGYCRPATEDVSNKTPIESEAPAYHIYLYSEYGKLKVGAQTDLTATLNFETSGVVLNGYINSKKEGKTLEMERKNADEWRKKVFFDKPGVFEVVATAIAPDGSKVEGFVTVEVVSAGIDH